MGGDGSAGGAAVGAGRGGQPRELLEEPRLARSFLSDHGSRFSACGSLPSRQQLVTGAHDGVVMVWSMDLGRPRPLRLGSHRTAVTCVAGSASGARVATASTDTTVCVWGVQAAKQAPVTFRVHYSPVRACDISPDERLVLSGSDDKLVKLSSLPQRKFLASLAGHTNWVRTAVFSPSGASVASGGDDKTVRLWDVERHEEVRAWYDCTDSVTCVRFDCQDSAVAACTRDSTINIWDARSHLLRQHYNCAHGCSGIVQAAFHPRRDLLVSASADKTLRLWDLRAGRLRSTIAGHKQNLLACCWDADGDHLVSCDSDVVNMWSLFVGQAARRSSGTQRSASAGAVRGPAVHQEGRPPLSQRMAPLLGTTEGGIVPGSDDGGPKQQPLPSAFAPPARGDCARPASTQPQPQPRPAMQADLAEALAKTVEGLVSQMGAISRSLEGLERRLASTEAVTREVAELAALRRREAASAPPGGPVATASA